MTIIYIIAFIIAFVCLPELRYTTFHIPKVLYWGAVDIYRRYKYKLFNEYKDYGKMRVYIANNKQPFGSGKSLNLVDYVKYEVYERYNGLMVWDKECKCFRKQRIKILSNIKLVGVPYTPLRYVEQITEYKAEYSTDILLVIIDEMGKQWNNRSWKTNLPSDLLDTLLQQRKDKMAILGTVQDWSLFDATIRKVVASAFVCIKHWRFIVTKQYWARDIERVCENTDMLQCQGVRCRFATDDLYNSYDTNEKVETIKSAIKNGEYLSNEEILVASTGQVMDINTLTHEKRKYRKRFRK